MNQTKYPRKVSPKFRLKIFYEDAFIEKEFRSYIQTKNYLIDTLLQNKINRITKITLQQIK